MKFGILDKGQILSFVLYNGKSMIEALTYNDILLRKKEDHKTIPISGPDCMFLQIVDVTLSEAIDPISKWTIYNIQVKGVLV